MRNITRSSVRYPDALQTSGPNANEHFMNIQVSREQKSQFPVLLRRAVGEGSTSTKSTHRAISALYGEKVRRLVAQ